MNLFKGYIITKNKVPLAGETFKNKTSDELRSYEEVKNLPDFAGIIEDGVMFIDVDDEKQSSILFKIVRDLKLKTVVYKTTRGMHFYFKETNRTPTNKTGTFIALGLKVDMKIGSRNSYAWLKHEGEEREIIYQTDELEELPTWLSPVNYTFPFLHMEKGDGRNQSLYEYILTLQSLEMSKSEIRQTLTLINEYVLVDKLKDSELNTIMRDDAFKKQLFFGGKNGNTFYFDKFAKFLISEHNIIRINNQLHTYRNGIYKPGIKYIENQMIQHIPTLKHAQRTEVLRYIDTLILENTEPSAANLIAFNNGLYDLSDNKFKPFSEDHVITNIIPWDYNPSSYSKLADKTLNNLSCNNKEIRMLLEEIIGYTFYRRNEMRNFFVLTGGKRNGKSTFIRMLQNLLGDENTSSLDMGELTDRFRTAELFGKLANLGDDISGNYIRDPNQLKKLSAGNTVTVEKKGEDPFDMDSYAKLIFSANDIPRIKDPTGATQDRMIIVPFNATFTKDDPDYNPYLRYELEDQEVMEYLINLGIKGINRVLINDGFTESEQVKEVMEQYDLENNPIKLFFKLEGIENIRNQKTADVYSNYQAFCNENGLQAISRIAFSRQVISEFPLKSEQQRINGKRIQVFVDI